MTADELADIAPQIKAFMDEVGDGTADIQVAINPHGEALDTEELTPAIGFAYAGSDEYEDEAEEFEDDEE